MPVRTVVAWLGAVGAATILHAQAATPAQEPAPQFRSGVSLLRVDASVVDSTGRAIGDLKPEDFHVTIDGQPRKVAFARFTGADETRAGSAAPAASYARNTDAVGGRAIVVVVDLESIRPGNEHTILETAAQLVDKLRPIDAAAVVPLPGKSVDLTRDHKRVSDAIRGLQGANHEHYDYTFTMEEALAFERRDTRVMGEVIERECSNDPSKRCRDVELRRQTQEWLRQERRHILMVLGQTGAVAKQLRSVRAPTSIVLLSGGMTYEPESLGRFKQLQQDLKETGVAITTVRVNQPDVDASVARSITALLTQDHEIGVANIATMADGRFYSGIGRAQGVFERLRTELTETYELGVEPRPEDLDGKPHSIKVTTTRKAEVHARRYIAAGPPPADAAARLADLIAQPVDLSDLPIAIAAHSVHGAEAAKLKVIIRADIGHGIPLTAPVRYQAVVIGANETVGVNVTGTAESDGSVLMSTQLAPGPYRVRLAATEAGGRAGTLELPIVAGLRAAGPFQLSDLIIGTGAGQGVKPSIYAAAGSPLVPLLELTTADATRFAQTTVDFELRRGGREDIVATGRGRLQPTPYDRQQIASGALATSELAPGEYTLTAAVTVDGQPQGRVSRMFVLEPAAAGAAPPAAHAVEKAPDSRGAAARTIDPVVDDAMHKAAAYVASYGEKMSAVVGVEQYVQTITPGVNSGKVFPPRQLVAEFALVKSAGATPWTGYRDVIEVDGKPITDRRDRMVKILTESATPLEEAAKLMAESARFNIGPVSRNFNLPTTALFFFTESNLPRFAFTRKGTTTIEGIDTIEIAFKETARPTLITTRAGKEVPCEGTLWVAASDGTVVRTRLQLRGFANIVTTPDMRLPLTPGSTGIHRGPFMLPDSYVSATKLESTAEIEVIYRRDEKMGMWLPAEMTEEYQGAIPAPNNQPTMPARARSRATYSDYKQFGTSVTFGVKK